METRAKRASRSLPVGTVTFLMTDIEGSTKVWNASPAAARDALAQHDRLLIDQVEKNQGQVVESGREGDSILAVFRQASDAVLCARDAQLVLGWEHWPAGIDVRVRMAVYTGEAELTAGHYVGAPLYRCARLMATGHGGQVLISSATRELIADSLPEGVGLRDLGEHRLRDFTRSEHVYQLMHADLPRDFAPLKSLEPVKTNLAEQLTAFVGRQSELAALRKLLRSSRLMTLLGTGGIGKSRLAIELGRSALDEFADGVWWIDLTTIDGPQHVAGAIATALQLQMSGPARENVAAWLAARKALVILDNCEHVIEGCAEMSRVLLERCPGVKVLATSRMPLGVAGEVRWSATPLTEADAMTLFELRGAHAVHGFRVTDANRGDVAGICSQLDALPLAIELAASRIGMMTARQISSQLADRFTLLSDRSQDARHQTLRTTIDWSYRLLTDEEAALFSRLSVFKGGFTLESASAICAGAPVSDVLGALTALIEKSMVVVERLDEAEARYRLLDSQAAYAFEKLVAAGEATVVQRAHFEYFDRAIKLKTGDVAGKLRTVNDGVNEALWKRHELGNLWAAMTWARDNTEDSGMELSSIVCRIRTVDAKSAREWLEDLLKQSSYQGVPRMRAVMGAGNIAFIEGRYDASLEYAQEALDLAHHLHQPDDVIALALTHVARGHDALGETQAANAFNAEAFDIALHSTNPRIRGALLNQKGIAFLDSDAEQARVVLRQALEETSDGGLYLDAMNVRESLANAELACGALDRAEEIWKECLDVARQIADYNFEIGCLGGLARSAAARRDYPRALRIAAAHERACRDMLVVDEPYWVRQLAAAVADSRRKLGDPASERAWRDGLAMDLDRAVEYALEDSVELPETRGPLSRREIEVARLVAAGLTNRVIADRLFITERTAEGHVERIRNKLGVRSRTEIATWAVAHGVGPDRES